jgi:cyclic-di-AMP phosphodiesterase PgpH
MMSSGGWQRPRLDRVAQFDLGPGKWETILAALRRRGILSRIAICSAIVLLLWAIHGTWRPPFGYRMGQVPPRDLIARATFETFDEGKTAQKKDLMRRSVECVYNHDPKPIVELRAALRGKIYRILSAENQGVVDPGPWTELALPTPHDNGLAATPPSSNSNALATNPEVPSTTSSAPAPSTTETPGAAGLDSTTQAPTGPPIEVKDDPVFESFRAAFANDLELKDFEVRLQRALESVERFGLLDELQHEVEDGSQTEITVIAVPDGVPQPRVGIEMVRRAEAKGKLQQRIREEFPNPVVSERIISWLESRLPATLTINKESSQQAARMAMDSVPDVMNHYTRGKSQLAEGGQPMGPKELELLRLEREAILDATPLRDRIYQGAAALGLYIAVSVLCGIYLFHRQPAILIRFRGFVTLLLLVSGTILLSFLCSQDPWQVELVPLSMFAIITAIAYRNEVALFLSSVVCLIVTLSEGRTIAEFVIYSAAMAAPILLLGHIRSRTRLIYVSLCTALVVTFTTIGVLLVIGRAADISVLKLAIWQGMLAILSGLLMTALLPFVEALMDVQTDISLLELGDVAHPLLQELVRRAPGTYNHSINVASIAQAAADRIGANGLLVRVGAYFHDIGKMLKPQYFIENQSDRSNRHESLVPAMSTLIIIAHVKDGADLARQHHLPQSVIDFIMQHHGTTLVEYFFDRAHRRSESDPDAAEVDEVSFRYPGPKPQTKEAAVLMIADAVEGATRSLHDPAPSRIENLVHEIALKRLLDGQFDECGITLKELHLVQESIVKSLIAMYHGRVKYPDQKTA